MASSINASTAGVGGVITTADNTGILNIQTAGTTAVTVNASQNVGIGVTPSAWFTGTSWKALQISTGGAAFTGNESTARIFFNAFVDSSGNSKYTNNGFATQYTQSSGQHIFYTAPSGTAGNAITFTQAMTLDASGNLLVGTTSATSKVVIKCSTNNFGGGLQLHQSNFDTRWEYIVGSDGKLYLGYGSATTPAAVGNFATNGTYTATSDIRKKKDITYNFNATEIVMRLKPAMGRMIDDSDESPLRPFYIAQDMTEVVPSLVSSLNPDQDAIDPIMGVDYASSAPLLAKMLQEQQIMIQELKAEIDLLKGAK